MFSLDGDNNLAKITGPATLELQLGGVVHDQKEYIINLTEGEFFQITSTEDSAEDISSSPEQQAVNVIVRTKEFSVEKAHVQEKFDLVITSDIETQEHVVNNRGDKLIMRTQVEGEQRFIALNTAESVSVDEQDGIRFIEEDEELIAILKEEIAQKELSLSYEVNSVETVDEIVTTTSKKVITKDLFDNLRNDIAPSVLIRYLNQVQTYHDS